MEIKKVEGERKTESRERKGGGSGGKEDGR